MSQRRNDRPRAAVNATRRHPPAALGARDLAAETAGVGRTRGNRAADRTPKNHAPDAVRAGRVERVHGRHRPVPAITETGRGSRQRTRLGRNGFPRGYLMRRKQVRGIRTGDPVHADVPRGKKAGTHTWRVAVRRTGPCNVRTPRGTVQGIHAEHLTVLQRTDGHAHAVTVTHPPHTEGGGAPARPEGRGSRAVNG